MALQLRTEYCSLNGMEPNKVENPYVHIYTRLTDTCQAGCKFCEYHDKNKDFRFDIDKFKQTVDRVLFADIILNKVSFTGGEPTLNVKMLNTCVDYVKDESPDTFISINTNGAQIADTHHLTECISLSRHHYDDEVNNEIFDTPTPTAEYIKKMQSDRGNLHLSCNLIKGFIDSRGEIFRFLEFAASVGIYSVGFVELMDENDYTKEHFVRLEDIDLTSDRLIRNRVWSYKGICGCSNFLYMPEEGDKVVKFYARLSRDHNVPIESSTVFDGYHWRASFCGEII